jgi:molybdopterin-binding protein
VRVSVALWLESMRRGSMSVGSLAFLSEWRFVMLSARNQFKGTVKSVKLGEVMAEIVVTVGSLEIVSAITRTSAETLGLKPGDEVKAVIKSTEVLIDKP